MRPLSDEELQRVRFRLREFWRMSFRARAKALGVSRDCLRNALRGGRIQQAKRLVLAR